MTAPSWSSTRPTEIGLYWFWDLDWDLTQKEYGPGLLRFDGHFMLVGSHVVEPCPGMRWLGPIAPPAPPEVQP